MKIEPFNRSPSRGLLPFGLSTCLGLVLAVWAPAPRAPAQTPAELSIQTYAGLTITGAVGYVYSIEYVTDLAQTNAWVSLTNLVLPTSPYLWLDAGCPATGRRYYRVLESATNNAPAGTNGMALIPAGSFTIGDTLDGESDAIPHTVTVSAFYMDTNLVTYSQWQRVYYWATSHGYGFNNAGSGKAMNHPVQTVDWSDCVKWCNARSQLAGLTPVYYTDAAFTQVFTNGEMTLGDDGEGMYRTVYANWSASGFRLPTEAEWERAARGGLSGQRFPWGNTISESQANYWSYWTAGVPASSFDVNTYIGYNTNYNTGGYPYTSPVGSFAPNGYGLYDMAGNVWEWCWDWYAGPPYPTGSSYLGGTDPRGPSSGLYRVLRGGAWIYNGYGARCATRFSNWAVCPNYWCGFRCVRRL